MQPQPVLDGDARSHRDRAGRDHAEAEPGRRDGLEAPRVGEEREDLAGRAGQMLLAGQDVDGHAEAGSR